MGVIVLKDLLLVRDVMVTELKTASPDSLVIEVVRKMNEHRIGSILVVDRSKPVGIVTEGDILRKVVEPRLDSTGIKVRHIMSAPVHTIKEDSSIEDAARAMTKLNVKRLAVVSNGKLVGIVTNTDLIRNAPTLLGLLQEFVRARYVPHELRTKS